MYISNDNLSPERPMAELYFEDLKVEVQERLKEELFDGEYPYGDIAVGVLYKPEED